MNNLEVVWKEGIKAELDFWEDWIINKGLFWPEEFIERTNPDTLLQGYIAKYLPEKNHLVEVLDVGSGPLSYLGKKREKGQSPFRITCTDPLGKDYMALLKKHNINSPAIILSIQAEELSKYLPHNYFDVVFMRNALDHSIDPKKVIHEMLEVVSQEGVIILEHLYNEAETQNYANFHQWNICIEEDNFIIWNKSTRTNINIELKEKAKIKCLDNGRFNLIEIRKST